MMLKTETRNPKIAESTDKVRWTLSHMVVTSFEPRSPTEVIEAFRPTIPSSGYVPTELVEELGRRWVTHWPERIFDVVVVSKPVGSETTEPPVSREAMLSPERRAVLERARAIRRKIGPVPWKICDLLREMDEENA